MLVLVVAVLAIGVVVLLAVAPVGALHVAVPDIGPGAVGTPSPDRRTVGVRARRIGLEAFFASVVVNAAIGIYAVLMPHFGDTAVKVLVTSLCVTGAMLMAFCCAPAWERRLLGPIPAAGAILSITAFAGLIAGIWTEPGSAALRNLLWSTFALAIGCTLASVVVLERARKGTSLEHERVLTVSLGVIGIAAAVAVILIWAAPSGDTVGKFVGTGFVAAVACVLAALLTLARKRGSIAHERVRAVTLGVIALSAAVAVILIWAAPSGDTVGRFAGTGGVAAAACVLALVLTLARLAPTHRWVLTVTLVLLGLGAALIVANIWLPDVWGLTRVMGVVLVVFAAFAVTVPVLHWVDRGTVAVAAATDDAVRFCPHCGRKLSGEVGVEAHCGRCGRGFTVVVPIST